MSIGEGQKIGNYRIIRRLGVGGMGTVYLAEHPLIGKRVALKVIHRELSSNKEVIARFFNEARAVNKIGNEHIVEIHDFGQSEEGEHFFIMEYLEGHTLAHELERGVFGVQRGLHIAAQIANGLAAAHSCGIIHRDLKPDNVMLLDRLGDKDFVKVLDFGLAKMIHDSASQKLTAAGVVLGTPQYMSPEACESKPGIDHRSDIYCLGILMFQMLTGRVPFEGNSMGEILVKHVSQAPPAPRAFNPNIPPSVEQIILRCLAKHPDARFPTMKALRDALLNADAYLASSPPVMPSALVAASHDQRTMLPNADVGPGVGFAATQALQAASDPPPARNDDRPFALRPPPPSIMTANASAKTAFLEAPPTNGSSAASSAKTAFMDGPVTLPADGPAPDGQKTAFMSSVPQTAAPEMPKRTSTAVPDMNQPMLAANSTMVIGTPEGYSDKPPVKKWPIVVALLSVALVVGGGVAALMLIGGDGKHTAEAAAADPEVAAADPDPAEVPEANAAVEPIDAAPTPPPRDPNTVIVSFTSTPDNVEIWTDDGELLGRTPKELPLPKGSGKGKQKLVFKHAGFESTETTVSTKADGTQHIELSPKKDDPAPRTGGSRTKPRNTSSSSSKKPDPKPSKSDPIKKPKDGATEGDTFKPDFEM